MSCQVACIIFLRRGEKIFWQKPTLQRSTIILWGFKNLSGNYDIQGEEDSKNLFWNSYIGKKKNSSLSYDLAFFRQRPWRKNKKERISHKLTVTKVFFPSITCLEEHTLKWNLVHSLPHDQQLFTAVVLQIYVLLQGPVKWRRVDYFSYVRFILNVWYSKPKQTKVVFGAVFFSITNIKWLY